MSDVKPRAYRSPLRERQAAASRAAVLAAARDLFLDQGYVATTVGQVALRAGVSKPTVFAAVGNKPTLLKTVRDVALAGDDEAIAVRDRPSAQRLREAPDVRTALGEMATHIADTQARSARVDAVLRDAAVSGDPELRDLWVAAVEQRRIGAGLMVDQLIAKGAPPARLSRAHAIDVLSLYMAPDAHSWLVGRCGWTQDDYRDWLERTLVAQLLGDTGADAQQPDQAPRGAG